MAGANRLPPTASPPLGAPEPARAAAREERGGGYAVPPAREERPSRQPPAFPQPPTFPQPPAGPPAPAAPLRQPPQEEEEEDANSYDSDEGSRSLGAAGWRGGGRCFFGNPGILGRWSLRDWDWHRKVVGPWQGEPPGNAASPQGSELGQGRAGCPRSAVPAQLVGSSVGFAPNDWALGCAGSGSVLPRHSRFQIRVPQAAAASRQSVLCGEKHRRARL